MVARKKKEKVESAFPVNNLLREVLSKAHGKDLSDEDIKDLMG